jgi:O-antigen/teichoic acid export membrane protein
MENLARKTAKNSIYSLIAYAWPIALAFIATPILVKYLGNSAYGILALVNAFVGFFAVLDFGVSPSLVKYLSEFSATGDHERARKVFSAAVFFYTCVGIVGGLLIALLAHWFIPTLLHGEQGLYNQALNVFYLASFGFFVTMLVAAYAAIPGALQRFSISGMLNVFLSTLSTIGGILLVVNGHGIVALMGWGILVSIIGLFFSLRIKNRLLPKLKLTAHVGKENFKTIFAFSGYAFLAGLSGIIIAQLDRLILGSMLGPSAVTYYVVPGNLTIKILGVVVAVTGVLFPLTSDLLAREDHDAFKSMYRRSTRLVLSLLFIGVIPMLFFANRFLLYWVGPSFAHNSTLVFQLLLLTYLVSSFHVIPFMVAYGAGRPKYSAFYAAAVAIINIVAMLILIPHYKINGAGVAYLIAVVPTTIYFLFFIERKLVKANNMAFYKSLVQKAAILASVLSIFSLALVKLISSLPMFFIVYLLVLAIGIATFFIVGLGTNQDKALIKSLSPTKWMSG